MLSRWSTIAPVVVVLMLVTLGVRHSLFSSSPTVILPQGLAVALSIWARRSFQRGAFSTSASPAGPTLIANGPYRIIRHPMYTAALLFIWSGILGHWSAVNALIGLIATATAAIRITVEERLLRARYADYAEYASRTKRFVPFIF